MQKVLHCFASLFRIIVLHHCCALFWIFCTAHHYFAILICIILNYLSGPILDRSNIFQQSRRKEQNEVMSVPFCVFWVCCCLAVRLFLFESLGCWAHKYCRTNQNTPPLILHRPTRRPCLLRVWPTTASPNSPKMACSRKRKKNRYFASMFSLRAQ